MPFLYAYYTDLTSSSPKFRINPTHSLSNVPIIYLQILKDLSFSSSLKDNHRCQILARQAMKGSSIMSLPVELEDYSGTNNEERNMLKYQSGQERAQVSICPEDPAQLRGLENKQQDKSRVGWQKIEVTVCEIHPCAITLTDTKKQVADDGRRRCTARSSPVTGALLHRRSPK